MRLLFATLGTLGDVTPLLALAQGLLGRGHRPVFLVPRALVEYVERRGFEALSFGPNRAESVAALRGQLLAALASPRALDERSRQSLLEEARGAFASVAATIDLIVRSHHVPGDAFRGAARRAIPEVVVCASDPAYLPVRDESVAACLYAFSPELVERQQDWPPNHHVTGFFIEEGEPFQPDPELEEFLEAGPAPVVVSFGSVVHPDPGRVARLVFDAASAVGCRVLVQRGWSGLVDERRSGNGGTIGYVPHEWLFRRASMVLHAASAGAVAAALRAGVPSVLVPHVNDQFAIARRLLRLGYARSVIPFQKLGVDALAGALALTNDDAALRQDLQALAARLRRESGVETACRIVEETAFRARASA